MRLNFSVLWFDDNEDYFDSLDFDGLHQEILSWGFSPDIKCVTNPIEFKSHSPFAGFDLIVVDRNLEGYQDGQEFISELRDNAVYTEVIFYTAGNVTDLWNEIYQRQLEGVFVSHRSDILSKISRIGFQSIRKVLDLENMRGIVMAEVGELDHLLDSILEVGIATLNTSQQNEIFRRFYDAALKQNQQDKERLDTFIECPQVREMLSLCDSNKRWQNFNRLWRQHEELRNRQRVGDYESDILVPRNFLAHGKPVYGANKSFSFIHRNREFQFNDAISLALRQTILTYKTALSEILQILSSK